MRTIAEGLGLGFPGASIYVVSMSEFFGPRNTPPGTITGQVTDSSTGAAIAGATVSYSGGSATTDGSGNYTLGLKEQIIFPEIEFDKVDKIKGMNITFVTTAETDEEAKELLGNLGMPFRS